MKRIWRSSWETGIEARMEAIGTDLDLLGSLVRNWVNVKHFLSVSFWPTRACTAAKCTREKLCVTIKLKRRKSVCHPLDSFFRRRCNSRMHLKGRREEAGAGEIVSSFNGCSRVAVDVEGMIRRTFSCHAFFVFAADIFINDSVWFMNR